MSDSDEDYMSDKLLQGSGENSDIRPGLLRSRAQERKHKLYKQEMERKAKKPKTAKEEEETRRIEGLNNPIPADNKGFQMLAKMGYQKGTGLGKSSEGITEPIQVNVKTNKSGVGATQALKAAKIATQEERQKQRDEELSGFMAHKSKEQSEKYLQRDFYKIQRMIQDLDIRDRKKTPYKHFYWTKEALEMMNKKIDKVPTEEAEAEEGGEPEEEDDGQYCTEDNLKEMIDYCRERYYYCMYCCFTGTDCFDLRVNCPGAYRESHDSD